MLSGNVIVAMTYAAHYEKNNYFDLLRKTFKDELGNRTSDDDIFNFMITASSDLILAKTPTTNYPNGLLELYRGAVIEDMESLLFVIKLKA